MIKAMQFNSFDSNSISQMGTIQYLSLMMSICLSLLLFAQSQSTNKFPSLDSLELMIQNQTFRVLSEGRTGIVYTVEDISDMSVSVIMLRSKTFSTKGVNLGPFIIPSKTLPNPYKKRIALVYQNWGNHSTSYFNVSQGYELVSPVISLLAYDSSSLTNTSLSNVTQLDLTIFDDPIYANLSRIMSVNESVIMDIECISFGSNGTMSSEGNWSEKSCKVNGTGHFAIGIKSRVLQTGQPVVLIEQKGDIKRIWIIGCVIVAIGLIMFGLITIGSVKMARKWRMDEMEREREEREILGDVIVGDCILPYAFMCRTKPSIENESKINP